MKKEDKNRLLKVCNIYEQVNVGRIPMRLNGLQSLQHQ